MLKSQSVNTRLAHGQYFLDVVSTLYTSQNTSTRVGFADTGVSLSPNFENPTENVCPLGVVCTLSVTVTSVVVHDSKRRNENKILTSQSDLCI